MVQAVDSSIQLLSDVVVFDKYAKYIPELQRRETWNEAVERNMQMHMEHYPQLIDEIVRTYKDFVVPKKVLPSMRSIQFGGKPIELNNARMYNCAYMPVDSWEAFHETMFLLLGGSGVGYSVQNKHIEQLPTIRKPLKTRKFVIGDSIEGWADSIKALIKAYMCGQSKPRFIYSDIRAKGSRLVTSGGKAPGPEPLRVCHTHLEAILNEVPDGGKLSSIQAHDMVCHIADAVLSGGIRRAALISLFDIDDEEMLSCKFNDWWEKNPQRGRANNSAVVVRSKITRDVFFDVWRKIQASGSGEPGFYFTNNTDWGANPCMSLDTKLLTPKGLRNLRDINEGDAVWSGEKWTKVTRKWKTGHKMVYKYICDSGYFLGTDNHEVYCDNEKIQVKDAECIDVVWGPENQYQELNPRDIMDGLMLGDGTYHKASNKVFLCIGNKDTDYHVSEVAKLINKERKGASPYTWEVESSVTKEELPRTFERVIPDRFYYGDAKKVAGFLRGLFSASGTVTAKRVQLKATSYRVVEQAQEMLSSLGIKSSIVTNKPYEVTHKNGAYTSRESYNLIIYNHSGLFMKTVGFIQKYKIEKEIKDNQIRTNSSKILRVEELGYEDVYDITVEDEKHRFWTSGLLVSNCVEIGLRPNQFCNLTEINQTDITTAEDFYARCKAASFIGTLQAGYTDFHYLRPVWQRTTERDALIGVGNTGIASGTDHMFDLTKGANIVKEENARIAAAIGIRTAARQTCVKPSGTTSCVVGSSSGIHAWHAPYYIRRIGLTKPSALYSFLKTKVSELVEEDTFESHKKAHLMVPQMAPNNAVVRETETALMLLERVKKYSDEWVTPGHIKGDNGHNVSCTISVKDNEWGMVGLWMWQNRHCYNGIAVLPHDGGSYKHLPFEEITSNRFEEMSKYLKNLDLTQVLEEDDNTQLTDQVACAGGHCEI